MNILDKIFKARKEFPNNPSGYEVLCDALLEEADDEITKLKAIVYSRNQNALFGIIKKTVELHKLDFIGKNDSSEADDLRDKMDSLFRLLSEDEIKFCQELSEQLDFFKTNQHQGTLKNEKF